MKQLFIILLVSTLLSCAREAEKVIATYSDGTPKIVYHYPNERDTLTYQKKVFYSSGKPDYIGNFVKGKKSGRWTWWYENGNKKDQCTYVKGANVDTIYHWYESGPLQQLEILPDKTTTGRCGECNGTIIRYFENGKLKEKFTSTAGMLNGPYTSYDERGGWSLRTYKDNLLEGPTHEHHIDSVGNVIIVTGQYANGRENGYWQWFNKDSLIQSSLHYDHGITFGLYRTYYPNGKVESEGSITNGEYQGTVLYYDSLGKLIGKENYRNGTLIK